MQLALAALAACRAQAEADRADELLAPELSQLLLGEARVGAVQLEDRPEPLG